MTQRASRLEGGLGFPGQSPVVQDSSIGGGELELVIVEPPLDSIRGGRFLQVPTMLGSVRDEGSLTTGCESHTNGRSVSVNVRDEGSLMTGCESHTNGRSVSKQQ